MARKHKRRTRKRNRKGGFLGPTMKAKMNEGLTGWKDGLTHVQKKGEKLGRDAQEAAKELEDGYNSKTGTGAGMLAPIPGPPATPPPMGPLMEHTKEKAAGGLFGLGWLGLGGRRLSHSSFINKMLRVRSKTKRNKAIRKYLKGGKKKTKKRRGSKKRRTRRRR